MSRRIAAAVALAVAGALLVTPQVLPASASTSADSAATVQALAPTEPPAGMAWIEGIITDQAGHPLDNVNVEAWQVDDGTERQLVASNLTYAGVPDDGRHGHGVFRLEVPIHHKYEIVFSTDQGAEDDDAFRLDTYVAPNGNDTIRVGKSKVRKLGASEIARIKAQRSTIQAKLLPTTVKVGKAGKVLVAIACKYVAPVTGKVTVAVGGKKVAKVLREGDLGAATLTMPKLKKPGTYDVEVWFLGTDTVKKSTKKLTLTVKK